MEGWQQLSNLSTNQSTFLNSTETRSRVYVSLPAGSTTKLIIVSLMVIFGIVGFVGNSLIYYFISKKKKPVLFLRTSPFVRNFNIYVKSLAVSNILCTTISIPLTCGQVMVDVLQQGWVCKIGRYLGILFPSITVNNLMVISMERYLSTRDLPRTFSVSTVRKLIWGAWIAGFVVVLGPTAGADETLYYLDDTHYTVFCQTDSYIMFRIISVSYVVIQYLIPGIILIYINISIGKTLWNRQRRRVDIQRNNAIKISLRAATSRGTYLLVAITFAFIIPHTGVYYYLAYLYSVKKSKGSVDFETKFITKYLSYIIFFSNSAINFIIHLVQMGDFRSFVKKLFCGEENALNHIPHGEEIELNVPAHNNR